MKNLILIISVLTLCGCQTLAPIKTQVELNSIDGKTFKYSSEKDVIAKVSIDPESGKITAFEFSAVASAPALAQVERDTVQAQTNLAQMQTVADIVKSAAKMVPAVPIP